MNNKKTLHFIGVGGIGMSGLADVYWDRGHRVTGSDLVSSPTIDRLRQRGMQITIGHDAALLDQVEMVVFSSAIRPDNVERQAAETAGIPCVPRAHLLGELMRSRHSIAVAGTHGKTTTSSLLTYVLQVAGVLPSFVLGGVLKPSMQSASWHDSHYMVVEADESDGSFVMLHPIMAIVTNIDEDHMEHYDHDLDRLEEGFASFIGRVPISYGHVILCADDPGIQRLCHRHVIGPRVITYGCETDADVRAKDITYDRYTDRMRYTVVQAGYPALSVEMSLVGQHNVLNALAVIAAARLCAVSDDIVVAALATFGGVKRRFDYCGRFGVSGRSADIFDDYAHHPQEILATYRSARLRFPDRRLCLVFQPHRYTRTAALLSDFVEVVSLFDAVMLLPVYPAGEAQGSHDPDMLYTAIVHKKYANVIKCKDPESVDVLLMSHIQDNDVWLLMGAGSIARVSRTLMTEGHSFRISPQ